MSIDNFKSMYYEMKIPLSSIYKDYSNLSSKSISIGIITGTIKTPYHINKQLGMNSRQGKPGGDGKKSGNKTNRPSGANGEQNNYSMTDITTPTTLWLRNIKFAGQ
ncbi:MAG: hypothetical protein U9R54_10445 [Bacteroidota bacterium]|nr:hypothetical protein [Bacteroidota bacterium]